jgi:hypothetical protein
MFLGDPFSNCNTKFDLNKFDLNKPAIEEIRGKSQAFLLKPGTREKISIDIQNNAFATLKSTVGRIFFK